MSQRNFKSIFMKQRSSMLLIHFSQYQNYQIDCQIKNYLNMKQVIFILATLLILTNTQNCASSLANDQLQAATYTFAITSKHLQCYNTSLTTPSSSLPQLAYGISNILNYQNDNGVDFSLRGHIDSSQIISFILIVNNATYGSLTVNYLISARTDFLAGSYIADTNQLLNCNSQQTALIPIPISTSSISSTNTLAILIFVNGLRTQSKTFNLKFQQPVLDISQSAINVTVITDAGMPIETIFFNYVIIDLTRLGLAFTYSFTSTPAQNSDLVVAGIVSVSNSSASQLQYAYVALNKTNRLSCVGLSCSSCVSNSYCTAAGGVVAGNQCIKCAANQVYLSGTGCACSNGYSLINGVCGVCPSGSLYSSSVQKCIVCGGNAVLSNGVCVCSSGYYNISGSCQTCPPGTAYSTLTLSCSPICSGGQMWVNGTCSCPDGSFLLNGICGKCLTGYSYNSSTLSCNPICTGSNQLYSNGQCTCTQGYTLTTNNICVLTSTLSNTVITCGANQYLSNGVCKCYASFVQYQGVCYQCPANSAVTLDQSGCVCNQGYTLYALSTGNICVLLSTGATTTGGSTTGSNSITSSTTVSNPTSNIYTTNSTTTNPSSIASTTSSSSTTTTSSSSSSSSSSSTPVCQNGYYLNGASCFPCSSNCLSCFTSSICISCSSGFFLTQSPSLTNTFTSSCNETCGDGKRYILPCDDGNMVNGDGCSSTCSIENGWTCSGGSSSSKDTCTSTLTTRINILKNVVFGNALYQNVYVSPLPSSLTANGCPSCPYLLNATLLTAPANSTIQSNFIPYTQYQYVLAAVLPNATFLKSGTVVISVKINSTYSAYFSPSDLAQEQILTVNLATVQVITPQVSTVTNSLSSESEVLGQEGSSSSVNSDLGIVLTVFKNQ